MLKREAEARRTELKEKEKKRRNVKAKSVCLALISDIDL